MNLLLSIVVTTLNTHLKSCGSFVNNVNEVGRFEVRHKMFLLPTYSGKVQLKPTCLLISPLIYLLSVCAKGRLQSEAAGREAVSGPPAAGPAEIPGAVHPEREQEG